VCVQTRLSLILCERYQSKVLLSISSDLLQMRYLKKKDQIYLRIHQVSRVWFLAQGWSVLKK
jgi:hypothetical protein